MKNYILCAVLAAPLFAQNPFIPQAPAPLQNPDPEIAVVDGHSVKVSDVRKMLEAAPPQFGTYFKQNPQLAIKDYFLIKSLAAQGEKEKLAEESPLKEQLEMLRAQVIMNAMVNHERDGYSVSADMIKAFYQQNISRYEKAKLKAIYIAYKPNVGNTAGKTPEELAKEAFGAVHPLNERTEDEAKKLAADVIAKVKAGAKFEDFTKLSDDPETKSNGGDFGFITPNSSAYPEEMRKAVFALKPGEVTAPVKQKDGYYILQLVERVAQPLDEVTEPIVQEIRQTHLAEFLQEQNKRFLPVVTNPDFFVKPEKYLAPPAK
jgi:peptidyl-prolyl cis-trans isomerase C